MSPPRRRTIEAPPDAPPARSHAVVAAKRSVRVSQTITIRRSAEDLYAFWREVNNFIGLAEHPLSITQLSATESRWIVTGPPGLRPVEWHAVIIHDEPGRSIAWRSRDGAEIPNAGSVHFRPAPDDAGTEVTVELRYEPPGGRLGTWIARLTGTDPEQQLATVLRRLQALMETGELPPPLRPLVIDPPGKDVEAVS